jgi:hypothetical protein
MMTRGMRQMKRILPPLVAKSCFRRNGLVYVVRLLQMFQEVMNRKLIQILGVGLLNILFHLITIGRIVTLVVIRPRHRLIAIT